MIEKQDNYFKIICKDGTICYSNTFEEAIDILRDNIDNYSDED